MTAQTLITGSTIQRTESPLRVKVINAMPFLSNGQVKLFNPKEFHMEVEVSK